MSTGNSFYFSEHIQANIENCESYNSGFLGFIAVDSSFIIVENFVSDNAGDAFSVQFKGTKSSSFSRVRVEKPNSCGIIVNENQTTGEVCEKITITDCIVSNTHASAPSSGSRGGILVQGTNEITIKGCLIEDNTQAIPGIAVFNTSKKCNIVNNIVQNMAAVGIDVTGTNTECVISGNEVSGCSAEGLEIEGSGDGNFAITGNIFRDNNTSGVFSNVKIDDVASFSFSGNTLIETTLGTSRYNLRLEATSNKGVVSGNTFVRNNAVDVFTETGEFRTDCPNINVVGNSDCSLQVTSGWVADFEIANGLVLFGRYRRANEPSTGTWVTGDLVGNNAPTAGTTSLGWVCTSGGSPGTWKSFGSISA